MERACIIYNLRIARRRRVKYDNSQLRKLAAKCFVRRHHHHLRGQFFSQPFITYFSVLSLSRALLFPFAGVSAHLTLTIYGSPKADTIEFLTIYKFKSLLSSLLNCLAFLGGYWIFHAVEGINPLFSPQLDDAFLDNKFTK